MSTPDLRGKSEQLPDAPSQRDALLELCYRYIEQRDTLYTQIVQPRRDAQRAFDALVDGDTGMAMLFIQAVVNDLDSAGELYRSFGKEPA